MLIDNKEIEEAIGPIVMEGLNKADFEHVTWNLDFHVEISVTIAELRALKKLYDKVKVVPTLSDAIKKARGGEPPTPFRNI